MKLRVLLLALSRGRAGCGGRGVDLACFNQFPKDQLKQKYNIDVTDQFVENFRLASLRIAGASGAFVSPKGLILTSRRGGLRLRGQNGRLALLCGVRRGGRNQICAEADR